MGTNTAERLKLVRKRLRLSQKQLADKIGVTTSLIAQIEISNRALTLENARKIAGVANTSPEWLLCETDFDPSEFAESIDNVSVCYLVDQSILQEGGTETPRPETVMEVFRVPRLKQRANPYLAIQVQGEGIRPIQEGDIVILERIETKGEFVDGRTYAISVTGTGLNVFKKASLGLEGSSLGKLVLTGEGGSRPQAVEFENVKMYSIKALIKYFP